MREKMQPPDPDDGKRGRTRTRRLPAVSLLDTAGLPIEELAAFAAREGSRPRQIYGAHRWFARRFGTAMRALLVSSVVPAHGDFWAAYYGEHGADLTGLHVLDPFVGGGTILYEAQRLGATITGVDVDPVACAVSRFEFGAADAAEPTDLVETLHRVVGKGLSARYRTIVDGVERIGLHWFWVQDLNCGKCDRTYAGHPNHLLGEHGLSRWTICPECESVQQQDASLDRVACACGRKARIDAGTVNAGIATCPHCGHVESLIDNARRTGRPRWRMAAIESIPADHGRRVRIEDRSFSGPEKQDLDMYDEACKELDELADEVPRRLIVTKDRADARLAAYGYRRYAELFNSRQLLHLVTTARAIRTLPEPDRLAAGLALSNHTLSNCMLTTYTARWRQVTPLFVVRSFRHSARPVELNPWLDGPGRGTFPNALRRVAAAIAYAKNPLELTASGTRIVPSRPRGLVTVINADSRSLSQIPSGSIDLVVTDPPYLDNIAYSELADFFVPWLASVGLTRPRSNTVRASLATSGRTHKDVRTFASGLARCFSEAARTLRPDGRLVFTFQHSSLAAWAALAEALGAAGLRAVTVFPLKGDGDRGLHHHSGTTTWDAVFVLRPGNTRNGAPTVGIRQAAAIADATDKWVDRLDLGASDALLQHRAALVAGTTGYLRLRGRDRLVELETALGQAGVR